jgi:TATA-box binding protein (TBP) (component of TFIID and TFIIIB)
MPDTGNQRGLIFSRYNSYEIETPRYLPDLTIVNIVATADLGQTVDLAQVSKVEHTIFDQEIYGGRVAYLKKPGIHRKVTIFPSGKLISVGTRSLGEAEADLQETADTLHNKDLIERVRVEVRLRNIVAVSCAPL